MNESIEKCLLAGTIRAVPGELTWKTLQSNISRWDVINISNDSALSPFTEIPIFQCRTLSFTQFVTVSQGKGLTPLLSKISAVMEMIELSYQFPSTEIQGSYLNLKEVYPVVNPISTCLYPIPEGLRQDLLNAPLIWTQARSLLDNKNYFLPSDLVRPIPYPCLGWWQQYLFPFSNGRASGNNLDEAILHGLLELVERQSRLLLYEQTQTVVNLESIDDVSAQKQIDSIVGNGGQLKITSQTHAFGIPCFSVEILWKGDLYQTGNEGMVHRSEGSGCHYLRGIALCRALGEAVQAMACTVCGMKDNIYFKPTGMREHNLAKSKIEDEINYSDIRDDIRELSGSDSFKKDIRLICDLIVKKGYDQVYAFDLGLDHPPLGITLCVVPGFSYGFN